MAVTCDDDDATSYPNLSATVVCAAPGIQLVLFRLHVAKPEGKDSDATTMTPSTYVTASYLLS